MHQGQAAVSHSGGEGAGGATKSLADFPPSSAELNNTGSFFFFFHHEQLCLEQQDPGLGITFQESGAALQKPR